MIDYTRSRFLEMLVVLDGIPVASPFEPVLHEQTVAEVALRDLVLELLLAVDIGFTRSRLDEDGTVLLPAYTRVVERIHANQIQGFFDIPLDHLKAEPVILKYIRDQHWASPIVVAPDTGGAKTAYGYSRKLKCGLAIVAKQRTGGDTVDAFSVVGDVKGHDVIMIDDMTATGGTLSAAAKMCRDNGAKSVHAFVSHFPLTEKGVERLMKEVQLDELVVTDSIPLRAGFDPAKLPFKLTQLSVAPLIGEAIRRTHLNESINDLFNHE